MMRAKADIERKVRSLLAVAAEGSGATAPEAATARAMADKLMALHGLTESEIPKREVERRRPPPPPTQEFVVIVTAQGFGGFSFGGATNTTTGAGW